MKILVIPAWHPTPGRKNYCSWIMPHISALREAGHDVYVLHVDLGPAAEDLVEGCVKKERHIYYPLEVCKNRFSRTRFCYGQVLKKYCNKLFELYSLIKGEWGRPEVVHAHVSLPAGYGAASLGRKEQLPVIITEHYSGFCYDLKYWWRVGVFARQASRLVQGVYAVSPGFGKRILQTGIKVTGVLPNPVDTNTFNCGVKPEEEGGEFFRIVTTGNLGYIKGTDILFEALKLLEDKLDWRLTVFGDTDNIRDYSKWLDDPGFAGRISLPGKVSKDELASVYRKSDLFVVSSRVETANVSMLEAMSCGVPVVVSRCGAPETLIDETVGLSFANARPEELAAAILKIHQNKNAYARELLHNYVKRRYSSKAVSGAMLEAYKKAIEVKQN